jgi:diguanylate cyclase (GGDEF)-like protein
LPALWHYRAALIANGQIAERLKAALTVESDPALVRARRSSELLVASVRLGIICLFIISNLVFGVRTGPILRQVMVMGGGALLYALVLLAIPRKFSGAWVPWAISMTDVTFVTSALVFLALKGFPTAALNNRVAFEAYFVAVTISALRFDWRLSACTAALTVAQYLGLTAYVSAHWGLETLSSPSHGSFIPVQHANRVLMLVGNGMAAVAVARWARHLRLMVGTDQLTGLLQRRPFLERIDEELARADLGRTSLSIAIFDVDEFHEYNRNFGHLEGDRALVRVAEQLKLGVRTTDLVARYGGEEFVVAFPRLDVQLAARRVEALRSAIQEMPVQDGGPLTVSAGIASWPTDGYRFEDVLKKADERLYAAKSSGRNMVIGPLPLPVRAAGQDPGA